MPLERVEVAQRRRSKEGRPEGEVGRLEDGVVVAGIAARLEAVEELAERRDPQPPSEQVVERRQRPPVEDAVVGQVRVPGDGPPAGDLEIDPFPTVLIDGRGEPPRRTGRGVVLLDMGDLHRGRG